MRLSAGKSFVLLAPSQIPLIPSTIIERILLHTTHVPTLKSCSLVSQNFRYPAIRLLFSAVTIRLTSPEENPYHAFLDLITAPTSKHIAYLIVSLTLSDFYMQDAGSTWLAYDAHILPRILACLINVTYLNVHAHENISAPIRAALITHVFNPQLRGFSARGLGLDLQDALARCQSLTDLRLADIDLLPASSSVLYTPPDDSELDITEYHKPSFRPSPPPLPFYHALIRQFSLQLTPSTSPALIDALLHASLWDSFAQLDVLNLDIIHFPFPDAIQRLLAATSCCTNQLRIHAYHAGSESLGFHIYSTIPRVTYRFTIPPSPCTTSLSFVDMFQPFHRLRNASFQTQSPNRYRGISDLRLELEMGDAVSLFERESWEWAWLDEVVGAVKSKVVVAVIIPGRLDSALKSGMERRIRECLPRAVERGVLGVLV